MANSDSVQWWIDRLTLLPRENGLPLFRPRSKVYSARRARITLVVPTELIAALAAASEWTEEPARHIWLSVLIGLLHRYTGNERIAVGVPSRIEPTGGEHIDPEALAIVTTIRPDASFRDLLISVSESVQQSHRRADCTFHELIARLGLLGVEHRNPLFDVAFRFKPFHAPFPDTRHDVTVELDAATLSIEFGARLFDPDIISRFGGHLIAFAGAALADSEAPVRGLPYLERDEIEDLVGRPSNSECATGAETSVHHWVTRVARQNPEQIAVWFQSEFLTFDQLNRSANRIAHRLIAMGVRPGDRVGLCLRPSHRLLVALLGILKSGAAVLPMDHSYPPLRLAMMMRDAGTGVVVTDSQLSAQLEVPSIERLHLDEDEMDTSPGSDHDPDIVVGPTDLVYILYTSGSTGMPKGVCMEHGSLSNLIAWQIRRSPDGGCLRTLQRTSVAFDVGFQEIFSTWCAGACLVVAPEEIRQDVSELPRFLAEWDVARAFLPPVTLQQLSESWGARPLPLPRLREIVAAGEQLRITPPIMRFFRESDCTLDNQYGPTETHVATAHRLDGPSTRWSALPPIGRPIDNARVYVLDDRRNLVPVGVVGELYIGGVPVARGYRSHDELTAAVFLPDPFVSGDGRVYKTGDMGRRLPDGTLEFLGRRDRQVKIRGYRLELGEIESALLAVPGIHEATVVTDGEENSTRRLVAYYVARSGEILDRTSICNWLRQTLPEHMVPAPSALIQLEALPLTLTGKIDRAALPPPSGLRPPLSREFAQSRNAMEQTISSIWSAELGMNPIGVNDGFLELGGQSLAAIKIVSRVNEHYGVSIALRLLLRGGSVSDMAGQVQEFMRTRLADSPVTAPGETAPTRSTPEAATAASRGAHDVRRLELPDGRRIAFHHRAETLYLYSDVFEYRTYDRHGIEYPDHGCVLDVGANVGLFTLYALAKAPGLRVFAFEPAPPLFESLRRNTESFGERVSIYNIGLSDRRGEAEFTYYPMLTGMSTFHPDERQERALLGAILENQLRAGVAPEKDISPWLHEIIDERLESWSYRCELATLSTVLRSLPLASVDLLKIDVQKCELEVLRGIGTDDWPRIRQVIVEVHQFRDELDQAVALLRGRGFEVHSEQNPIHQGSVVHFVYAAKKN